MRYNVDWHKVDSVQDMMVEDSMRTIRQKRKAWLSASCGSVGLEQYTWTLHSLRGVGTDFNLLFVQGECDFTSFVALV